MRTEPVLKMPDEKLLCELDTIMKAHRVKVEENLSPLVSSYCPAMADKDPVEYRKMIELTTKMTMVGHACADIAGYPFDDRRLTISSLFGACCFIADSFIDDFGEAVAREYVERFELLLTKGWFEVRNERERLFYVIISRLFAERDVLDPMLRQAILGQFLAQKRDIEIRFGAGRLNAMPRSRRLSILKECARDRGGCVTMVLSLLLVPGVALECHHLLYRAGAMFMYIDDHGDCHYDLYYNRITYMNQVSAPLRALRRIFNECVESLDRGLPESFGKKMLIAFLYRYFVTRLQKHRLERNRGQYAWTIYE